MSALYAEPTAAQAVLSLLDYLSGLFTGANKETFSRTEVLLILNAVQSDPDLIEPEAVIAFEIATAGIEEAEG